MDLVKLAEEREKNALMEKKKLPDFRVGDTVKVFVEIKEGDKTRLQGFEGIVLKIKGSGINKTFTVRRVSFNVGVERTFPYVCPFLKRIEVKSKGRTRRSKVYFIRDIVSSKVKSKLKPREKRTVRKKRGLFGLMGKKKKNKKGSKRSKK